MAEEVRSDNLVIAQACCRSTLRAPIQSLTAAQGTELGLAKNRKPENMQARPGSSLAS